MVGNRLLVSTKCQTKYLFSINLGNGRPKNQRVFISSMLATIKKSNNNFFFFCHYCWIPSCKTLSGNSTVLLFGAANQFHSFNSFFKYGKCQNFTIMSPNIRKMHFWGTSSCFMGILCLHTPTKSSLAVILRDQPSFIGWRDMNFVTVCPAPAISEQFPANRPWPKIWHLFFLTLLVSYNQFLKRKWIYMEVHTGGNSVSFLLFSSANIFCHLRKSLSHLFSNLHLYF